MKKPAALTAFSFAPRVQLRPQERAVVRLVSTGFFKMRGIDTSQVEEGTVLVVERLVLSGKETLLKGEGRPLEAYASRSELAHTFLVDVTVQPGQSIELTLRNAGERDVDVLADAVGYFVPKPADYPDLDAPGSGRVIGRTW